MQRPGPPASSIAPDLLRAARAALDWSLVEAGRRAKVSVSTVVSAEGRGVRSSHVSPAEFDKLRRAYDEAGVRLFDEGSAGRGIQISAR